MLMKYVLSSGLCRYRSILMRLGLAFTVLSLSACSMIGQKMPWSDPDSVDYALISENLVDILAQYPRLNPRMAVVQASAPDNPIVVRGADEKPLMLNDAQLFPNSNSVYSSVQFLPTAETKPVALEEPVAATPEIADAIPIPVQVGSLEQYSSTFDSNLFDKGGQSNFSDLFAEYQEVDSNVLVFPNDSLQLGDINKQIIEQYVEKMDPSTDVLSVIGCSHGDTAIENNGNALLALGRANRVKEAFMFSGVSHDLIVEEGCWAPMVFEGLPSRGVVLKLKRRIDS